MLASSGGLKDTRVLSPDDGKMNLALTDCLHGCRLVCTCHSKVWMWTGWARLFLHGLDVLKRAMTCTLQCCTRGFAMKRAWARLQHAVTDLLNPFLAPEWLALLPSSLRRMPRVRTDPVPSCSGCDPAVERGHTTLPTEDAPIAHYRATQCAVCRMVVSLQNLTFHALLQPDGDLYLYLGVLIPAIPSLRHHLHHVSIGVVKPRVRVDLMPTLHHLEQLVAAHRQHITHVQFVPHGRGLHFEIPPAEPLAQLVQVLRAHLCANGFLFSYKPVPHVTWL